MIILVLFTPILSKEELIQVINSHLVYNTTTLTRSFIRIYYLLEKRILISFSDFKFAPIHVKETHLEEKIDEILRENYTPEKRNTTDVITSPSVQEITSLYHTYYFYQLDTLQAAMDRNSSSSTPHSITLKSSSGRQIYSSILREREPIYMVVDGSMKYLLHMTSRAKGNYAREGWSSDQAPASKTTTRSTNPSYVV